MSYGDGAKRVFRRIGGRVVPIVMKAGKYAGKYAGKAADRHPVTVGITLVAGSAVAATKTRRFIAKKIDPKSRGGFGNELANNVVDAGLTAGALYGLHRFGGTKIRRSLDMAGNVISRYGGFMRF